MSIYITKYLHFLSTFYSVADNNADKAMNIVDLRTSKASQPWAGESVSYLN